MELQRFVEDVLSSEYVYNKEMGEVGFIMPVTYPDGTPFTLKYSQECGCHMLTDGGGLRAYLERATSHLDKSLSEFFVMEIIEGFSECADVNVCLSELSLELSMPDNVAVIRRGISDIYKTTEKIVRFIHTDYMVGSRYYKSRATDCSPSFLDYRLYRALLDGDLRLDEGGAEERLIMYIAGHFPSYDRDDAAALAERFADRQRSYGVIYSDAALRAAEKIKQLSALEYEIICRYCDSISTDF